MDASGALTTPEFVTLWTASDTFADFCERSGYTAGAAGHRAYQIRLKHGIPLKHFKTSRNITPDVWAGLRELVLQQHHSAPHLIDLVEFVKVWQSSQSTTAVCQKMKMTIPAAAQQAHRMRQHGIPLKYFQRKGWSNALLRELGRYAQTTGQPAHFVVGPMRRRIAYLEAQVEKLEQQLRVRK